MCWLKSFIILIIICGASSQNKYNEDEVDIILSASQKNVLDKFKKLMSPKLPHDYMKEDIYLIKFLKVNDFDIPSASKMLQENLKWRQENKMDTILDEDWSDLHRELKFVIEGCDYEGRPTAVAYVSEWDLRKYVIAGKGRMVMRYADKIYEESNIILRNMQARGSNATRANLILEVSGFSLRQHLCPGCIPILAHLVSTLHTHFPLTINFLIVVNTPQIALPIWDIVKPLMPKKSQEFVFIYGTNKDQWQKRLFQKHKIDPMKLSKGMGGLGPDGIDFEKISKSGYYYECPK